MKTSEFLRAAKARIDTPEKWWAGGANPDNGNCACQAVWLQRDSRGLEGAASDPADFALARCVGYDGPETPEAVVAARKCVYAYNDAPSTTHADIMALFDRAIAAEEAAEGLRDVFPSEWVRTEVPA